MRGRASLQGLQKYVSCGASRKFLHSRHRGGKKKSAAAIKKFLKPMQYNPKAKAQMTNQ
jgi:hypothetical protein